MSTGPEPPEDITTLYHRAFAEYGARALWNMRPVENPTPADALALTKALRTHGRMDGRRLAEKIEGLCRATSPSSRIGERDRRFLRGRMGISN